MRQKLLQHTLFAAIAAWALTTLQGADATLLQGTAPSLMAAWQQP